MTGTDLDLCHDVRNIHDHDDGD